MSTEHNDFDAGPANEMARAAEARRAAAQKAVDDDEFADAADVVREIRRIRALRREGRTVSAEDFLRDPEDPEASPWPALAVVAVVLCAAALAWWFA